MGDEHVNQAVGRALAAMRRAHGYSQERVGKALGVNQVTISHWENGRRTPDVKDVTNYASALGSTPAEVFTNAYAEAPDEFTRRARELAAKINKKEGAK